MKSKIKGCNLSPQIGQVYTVLETAFDDQVYLTVDGKKRVGYVENPNDDTDKVIVGQAFRVVQGSTNDVWVIEPAGLSASGSSVTDISAGASPTTRLIYDFDEVLRPGKEVTVHAFQSRNGHATAFASTSAGWLENAGFEIGNRIRAVRKIEKKGRPSWYDGPESPQWEVEIISKDASSTSTVPGGMNMIGQVYNGSVVRTRTVAAGAGVSTSVQVSEIVYNNDAPFIAQSDEQARGIILAKAAAAVKDLNIADSISPVEVRLTKY